jgi:O-antigen ligase
MVIKRHGKVVLFSIVLCALVKPPIDELAATFSEFGFLLQAIDLTLICMNAAILIFLIIQLFGFKYKPSMISLMLIVLAFIFIFATYYNSGFDTLFLMTIIKRVGPAVNYCLLIDYCFQRKHIELFIKSHVYLLFFLVFVNVITILLYPDGMYISRRSVLSNTTESHTQWVLGYEDNFILYALPLCVFAALYAYYKKRRLTLGVMVSFGIAVLCEVLPPDATKGVVIIILFLICFLLNGFAVFSRMLTARNTVLVSYIAFFSIVVFRVQYLFSYIIVDVLGKSLTFTNRTVLWDNTFLLLKQHWLMGQGYRPVQYMRGLVLSQPHCGFLEVVLIGGIGAGIVFLCIQLLFIKKMRENENNSIFSKIIVIAVFMYMIMFIFGGFESCTYLFAFMNMGNYIYYFDKRTAVGTPTIANDYGLHRRKLSTFNQ